MRWKNNQFIEYDKQILFIFVLLWNYNEVYSIFCSKLLYPFQCYLQVLFTFTKSHSSTYISNRGRCHMTAKSCLGIIRKHNWPCYWFANNITRIECFGKSHRTFILLCNVLFVNISINGRLPFVYLCPITRCNLHG